MPSVANETVTTQSQLPLKPEYGLWDRMLILRDQLIATLSTPCCKPADFSFHLTFPRQ
jgi:hypothetical protein